MSRVGRAVRRLIGRRTPIDELRDFLDADVAWIDGALDAIAEVDPAAALRLATVVQARIAAPRAPGEDPLDKVRDVNELVLREVERLERELKEMP